MSKVFDEIEVPLTAGDAGSAFSTFPAELRARPQLVVWRLEERGGKTTKVPYSPRTGRLADSSNPATWATYDDAVAAYRRRPDLYSGIGYVFAADDPYTGVDLDKCIDLETGAIEPWALAIVSDLDSYTELSPSRRGFHIIVKAAVPAGGNRRGQVEMYDHGRFFTVTGNHWEGTPQTVQDRQEALAAVHARVFAKPEPRKQEKVVPIRQGIDLDDAAILDKASQSKNGAEFAALWRGNTSGHGDDHSAADLALCCHLAFWTDRDHDRIDRLFRQSGLMRPKWDVKHYGDGRTYGHATIEKAIESTQEGYSGRRSESSVNTGGAATAAGNPTAAEIGLMVTAKGKIVSNLANVVCILEKHPAWNGVFAYDQFSERAKLVKCPPYLSPDNWEIDETSDVDTNRTRIWLQKEYQINPTKQDIDDAIQTVAWDNRFHPVREYLNNLQWDGIPRLDKWLTDYFGAEDSAYTRAVASKSLIAPVARVYRPGCKVDTVLILEGEQGLYKSTALKLIAGDEWFTDTLPDLHSKDAMQSLAGKWIIELGELSVMGRSEVESVKRFISASQDHFRPSFGRRAKTFQRQCVFFGSTNKDEYLKDETGNRRFWPVKCYRRCDLPKLVASRDQLWAEAVHRFKSGEKWYLTGELVAAAAEVAADRAECDVWEGAVLGYLEGIGSDTSIAEILADALNLDLKDCRQMEQNRVARILRKAGWTRFKSRAAGGGREWRYRRLVTPPTPSGGPGGPSGPSMGDKNGHTGTAQDPHGYCVCPSGPSGPSMFDDVKIKIESRGDEQQEEQQEEQQDTPSPVFSIEVSEPTGTSGTTGTKPQDTWLSDGPSMPKEVGPTGTTGTADREPGADDAPDLDLPPIESYGPAPAADDAGRWESSPRPRHGHPTATPNPAGTQHRSTPVVAVSPTAAVMVRCCDCSENTEAAHDKLLCDFGGIKEPALLRACPQFRAKVAEGTA